MKELLERIRLIQYLTTEIEIQKSEFVDKFRLYVDDGDTGMFSHFSDIFAFSKNEYKGEVKFDRFKIKRRRRIFETNFGAAVASGTFRQNDDKLIIETEINGLNLMTIPFYVIAMIIYLVFIVMFLISDGLHSDFGLIGIPFILIHGMLMMSIPYFVMRRSVRRMKYDLEREFYYLANKK